MGCNEISDLIKQENLPESFENTVSHWYTPLASAIAGKTPKSDTAMVLGIQGTQGSGKSTCASFLKLLLEKEHKLSSVILSLDDFYLTRAARAQLAESVHPLLMTRGVPGTHEVELAINTINALKSQSSGTSVAVPRFNKAIDDRYEEDQWTTVSEPVDIIILEGWCLACDAESENTLNIPINTLEEKEDAQAIWRNYVNEKLSNEYQALFSLIDYLTVLNAPSFDCVLNWRILQEKKLEARWKAENQASENTSTSRILSEQEIIRFVSHFERITRRCLNTLPKKAQWLLQLGADHQITDFIENT